MFLARTLFYFTRLLALGLVEGQAVSYQYTSHCAAALGKDIEYPQRYRVGRTRDWRLQHRLQTETCT